MEKGLPRDRYTETTRKKKGVDKILVAGKKEKGIFKQFFGRFCGFVRRSLVFYYREAARAGIRKELFLPKKGKNELFLQFFTHFLTKQTM